MDGIILDAFQSITGEATNIGKKLLMHLKGMKPFQKVYFELLIIQILRIFRNRFV